MPVNSVARAIAMLGGPSEVARRRGKTAWAVSKWRIYGIPAEHVLWLAAETGFRCTPHDLAPQFYPHCDDGLPDRLRDKPARQLA